MTKQQEKVYRYILENRGCTTKDIMLGTGIQCPSGRISELRNQGVDIISVGHRKYAGSKAFELYAIGKPLTKTKTIVEVIGNVAYKREIEVNV